MKFQTGKNPGTINVAIQSRNDNEMVQAEELKLGVGKLAIFCQEVGYS